MVADSRPPLLYLVHRIPYPPNKGDKVRSFNILRQLARSHRVFLGTFVDDPDDLEHVAHLSEWCAEVHVVTLNPRVTRLASLRGLFSGEALSLPYYRDAGLRRWVGELVRRHHIRQAIAFSGPMAQYLDQPGLEVRIIDFCDVDSAKWTQYAAKMRWPMSWVYRREGARLLAFERAAALAVDASTFVTDAEADLFRQSAPEAAGRVVAVPNGVDSDYFSPATEWANPYPPGGPSILFTGAMDYWPNVDAVTWFAGEILPRVRVAYPDARFYIVGMNPTSSVQALVGEGIVVTGTVPDIRPWLAHADVVAAPLRVARGIQNKVLEAMAMARPVVVSTESAAGLAGRAGLDFVTASGIGEFVDQVGALLADARMRSSIGANARECVLRHYSWQAHLQAFDQLLAGTRSDRPAYDTERIQGANA